MRTLRHLLVILAGIIVVLFAFEMAVSAHHPIIEGEPSCVNPLGGYTVEWTVTADEVRGLEWTIDGVTKPDSEPFVYTTSHNLDGPIPTLTKFATWSNGVTGEATGTSPKPERCTTTSTTIDPTTTIPETTTTNISDDSTTTSTIPAATTTATLPPAGLNGGDVTFAFGVVCIFVGGLLMALVLVRRS
jgi:hypothetical protein